MYNVVPVIYIWIEFPRSPEFLPEGVEPADGVGLGIVDLHVHPLERRKAEQPLDEGGTKNLFQRVAVQCRNLVQRTLVTELPKMVSGFQYIFSFSNWV